MPDTTSESSKPIDVLLLTPQLSRAAGGVWSYLNGLLADGLPGNGIRATVAGVVDRDSDDFGSIRGAAEVIAAPPTLVGSRYGYSQALGPRLREHARFDVIHAQGLRTFAGRETLRLAKRSDTPYLLTPHGMFHPQLRNARSLKKWLIDAAWDRRYIERAACLHATSDLELSIIRDAGIKHPVAVVPIGVDAALYDRPTPSGFLADHPDRLLASDTAGKRRVLFLGILNRKKGLERLLEAWSRLGSDEVANWTLLIAGPDDNGHLGELVALRRALAIQQSTGFLEPVWGDDKRALLTDVDLFVLPSDWENFGIVIAEALAARLPVIATTGAPWRELQTYHCGWWIEPTVPALIRALREAFALSDDERGAMGDRGRALVESRYRWAAIGQQMASLYRWLAGQGERPPFVA